MLPLFLDRGFTMTIAYEPHPVSPERKKELRDQGLKIVDARFAPVEEKTKEPEQSVRRGRPSKNIQAGEE